MAYSFSSLANRKTTSTAPAALTIKPLSASQANAGTTTPLGSMPKITASQITSNAAANPVSASRAASGLPTSSSAVLANKQTAAPAANKNTNAVATPSGGYMPMSQDQLTAAASAELNAQLQSKQSAAAAAMTAAQQAYGYTQQQLRDNRVLEDGHFDRTNAPASWDGSTGYRGAMVDRNRTQMDSQLAQQYASQLASIQQGVTDFQGQLPSLIQAREAELKAQERNYGLDYAGQYGSDPLTGKQTAAYQGQLFNQGLSREQQDLANKNANLNAALSVGDQTGKVVKPQDDWTGLFRQANNAETPLNLSGQNQQLNNMQVMATLTGYLPNGQKTSAQQAQELSQLWSVADATGIIPDGLASLYGLPSGTQTLQAKQFALQQWQAQDNSSLGWANNALAQDDNARGWASLDAELSAGSTTQAISGTTAGQMLSQALQKQNGVDDEGKAVYGTFTDPATREKMFVDTWNSSGVESGADTLEMLIKAGYTTAEINAYKKKYPQAFNSGGGGGSTPVSVKVPQQYATLIESNNKKYGLPSGLLAAIADAESDFNPNAKNKSGASGMFQFMPATAKGYGIDPFNPTQAADAAGKMMSGLIAKYKGDVAKALAGYNWGGGNVDKAIKQYGDNWLAHAPAETKGYIQKILG